MRTRRIKIIAALAAAAVAALLLAGGLILLYALAKLVRRGWRRWKGKDLRTAGQP